MSVRWALASCLLAAMSAATPARAAGDAPVTMASEAYQRGAAAFDAGDYARAAIELARADELVPNPTVLRFALKSVLRAGDPVLAMVLAERAKERGLAVEEAREARARAEGRVGRAEAHCPSGATCTATIDGAPVSMGVAHWVLAGDHTVEIVVSGVAERHRLHVDAGALAEVRGAPPPPRVDRPSAPAPARVESRGLPKAVFWVSVAATAALGAGTIASGVDTANKHDVYLRAPTSDGKSDGQAAQTRTNVLLGATAATALLTAGLGIFAVQWSRGSTAVQAAAAPTGVLIAGRWP